MNRAPLTTVTVCALLLTPIGAAAAPLPDELGESEGQVVVLSKIRVDEDEGERPRVMFLSLSGGYLGVQLTDLTPELRTHFGVPDDRGVLVARVEEESPAAEAGLAVGDVITEIDGAPMDSAWDVGVAVRRHAEGEALDLEIWRDGRPMDFTATVRERERERIELGGLMDEGRLRELPELSGMRWLEGREENGPIVHVRPRIVEELGEHLGKIDWPALQEGLHERNRELEARLKELEQRLKELERRLDETPPQ